MPTLPAFALRHRLLAMTATMLAACAGLLLVWSHPLRAPVYLPMTGLDRAIPLVPAALPVYLSHVLFWYAAFWTLRDPLNVNRANAALAVTAAISLLFYFVQPTIIPIQDLTGIGPPWRRLFLLINRYDNPLRHGNCCPSLHVSFSVVCALAVARERRDLRRAAVVWAAAIMASVLLVKVHYAVDVPAGIAVAFLAQAVVDRCLQFTAPK